MRLNASQAISTPKLLLVPYSAHHVPTYHTWMQDPDLQAATASEPLTLKEEYAMQRSWREDKDKLTFIICLPRANDASAERVLPKVDDARERMIGDINLFLFEPDDEDEDDNEVRDIDTPAATKAVIGEIELMIARKDLHRQGFGRAALDTFMNYIIARWPAVYQEFTGHADGGRRPSLAYLRAKIQQTNVGSVALFESVGFKRVGSGEPNYFGELELRWHWDGPEPLPDDLKAQSGPLRMLDYHESDIQPADH
ncbi:hypothetical protein LTR86_004888 [Recurvomyces mirabilis]|nr:hypothetical protein LTR86_004888 [Recurvomyces mirabilis]